MIQIDLQQLAEPGQPQSPKYRAFYKSTRIQAGRSKQRPYKKTMWCRGEPSWFQDAPYGRNRLCSPLQRENIKSFFGALEHDFAVALLAEPVIAKMPTNTHVKLDFSKHENGGLHFSVDGITAATSICVWSNGYCDIEYIETNSEEHTAHPEFHSLSDAVETIVAELHQALERAGFYGANLDNAGL